MNSNLFIGKNIVELDSIDSTNNYLSNLLNKTNVLDGTVILAHNQTKGKGQRGNSWESEGDKNLTFSVYLKTNFIKIDHSFWLSMVVCNSLHELVHLYDKKATIKWPNDILVSGKKIGGILIENSIKYTSLNHSIIGIGFNINQHEFKSLSAITSLFNLTKKTHDKIAVLARFCSLLEKNFLQLKNGRIKEVKDYYYSHLIGYEQELTYKITKYNILVKGKIIEVLDSGLLKMVVNENQIKTFEMKEVQLIA